MSSTVAKAISLLNQFSEEEPEIGLSELARRTKVNKASVHRMLTVLAEGGLVEQVEGSRAYTLGAGILRLAQIREASLPLTAVLQTTLESLSEATGETAHASLISGRTLATVGISESQRSTRVSLEAGEILPLHSTASGLAVLAFCPEALLNKTLSSALEAKTKFTMIDPKAIRQAVEVVRNHGYSEVDQGNEEDVHGIAVPFFDDSEQARGAIAVATPCHRMTPSLRSRIIRELLRGEETVTYKIGGKSPDSYKAAVEKSLASLSTTK